MSRKNIHMIAALVPLVLSATIVVLLFSKIRIQDVSAAVMKSRLELLVPALLLSLGVNVLLGASKWRFILGAMNCRLPFAEVLALRTGCIPFKILLPMKSSELLKAVYLSRHAKLPFIETVSSLLIDKAMNLVVVLAILTFGLALTGMDAAFLMPLLPLFLIALLIFTGSFRGILIRTAGALHPRIHGYIQRLLVAFEGITGRNKFVVLIYSIVYQLSEFINIWLLFQAVGVSLPVPVIMTWAPLIMIVNNLPISILGIGTREAGMLMAFSRYGADEALLGGGLLVSLVEHVFPVVVGLFFMHRLLRYYQTGMENPEGGGYGSKTG